MANIISILRIIFSLSLIFVDLFTWKFVLLHLLCGARDILDGYIARKTKTESIFGAKLDTIADTFKYAYYLASDYCINSNIINYCYIF